MDDSNELRVRGASAYFGDMTWPRPCDRLGELVWTLSWGKPTRSDRLLAASVISAYQELIRLTDRERRPIIRALRRAKKMGEGVEEPPNA